ncbi:hypothetical protein A4H97_19095 [Niastella yeongjuensis]|uniref:Glycosyltransferase RgtA/B/C/D-like domain-containing protein n=1 Tax=Niastella yeongjuensis TaxID=354355 RepID=A0A1V9DY92_9BACT|nr:hypothetical protein [Niastella yeongjuensis]OQP38822.1 hypothetical protein A4H97_19095 [Niastella yeongjuensis]SEO31227.1 hypothetical protein SAMN05660816_02583 [Niastella yeongjuensis]
MISKISWLQRLKDSFTSQPTATESFSRFLIKDNLNKKYLLIATAGIFIQFILFKLCYPFADYFNDSYTYIDAAAHNYPISVRPLGFSRFLSLVHHLSSSDTALVFIHYLTIQLGLLYLFFTLRFFFPLRNSISHVLFALLIFNPVTLYLSNYVSSDAMFASVSIVWFTLLIWLINRPTWTRLLVMAELLYLLFQFRYTALYLPLVTIPAILFSRRNWFFKISGIVLVVVPMYLGMQHIKNLTYKDTGTRVFSAFGSWMATNNALQMYPYIKVQDKDLPTADCIAFNKIVKQYFDTLPASARPGPVDLLWLDHSPLKTYMHALQKQKKINGYFRAWHAVAPVFMQYSNTLLLQHPVAYMRYYMLPNAKTFFLPPLECLLSYNEQKNTVDSVAMKWFRYKSNRVTSINKTIQASILSPMPGLWLLSNIIFCGALVFVLARAKRYRLSPVLIRTLLIAGAFWGTHFCFSIYAASIVFRFQYFPMIVTVTFSLILINILTTHDRNKPVSTM